MQNSFKMKAYNEALRFLEKQELFGIKLGLENIRRICELLGNPQNAYPSIHIAGTNGKGSVAAMCSSILHASKIRTGLYTSPHLQTVRERICIDGSLISKKDFAETFLEVKKACDILKEEGKTATYFEFVTAMAFLYFKTAGCQAAVIETGMGGRLDATNIVRSKVAAVTSIDLEHCEHLGNTKEKIAFEKAGIIKQGGIAVLGKTDQALQKKFSEICRERNARLIIAEEEYKGPTGLAGKHQKRNASVAYQACLSFGATCQAALEGIANARWPGRLEKVQENPEVILDGAHNPSSAKTLADHLSGLGKEIILVLGISEGKESQKIIASLAPLAKKTFLTSANYRGKDCKELLEESKPFTNNAETVPSVKKAAEKAVKQAKNELVIVTGSLFVVGEARALWLPEEP